jgi:hypothetical protein
LKRRAYEITKRRGRTAPRISKKSDPASRVINMEHRQTPSFILQAIGLKWSGRIVTRDGAGSPAGLDRKIMPVIPWSAAGMRGRPSTGPSPEQGNGHTMAIHSNNLETIRRCRSAKCAAFVKNGSCGWPASASPGRGSSLHIATNGEGHTGPGSSPWCGAVS